MALTRNFDDTVIARARSSKTFRTLLLESAINELLNGDFQIAKISLRQYVNAAISFEELAVATKMHNKSIQRMLSATGNPTTSSLLALLHAIQKIECLHIQTKVLSN